MITAVGDEGMLFGLTHMVYIRVHGIWGCRSYDFEIDRIRTDVVAEMPLPGRLRPMEYYA